MRFITYNKEYDLIEIKETRLNGFELKVELLRAFKPTSPFQREFVENLTTIPPKKSVDEIFERYDKKMKDMLENLKKRIEADIRRLG